MWLAVAGLYTIAVAAYYAFATQGYITVCDSHGCSGGW